MFLYTSAMALDSPSGNNDFLRFMLLYTNSFLEEEDKPLLGEYIWAWKYKWKTLNNPASTGPLSDFLVSSWCEIYVNDPVKCEIAMYSKWHY